MPIWSDRQLAATFYACVLLAVTAGAWGNIEPYACPVPNSLLSLKLEDGLTSPPCLEFWFSRYQTMIGAGAAIGAGWLAYAGVQAQIARADAQTDVMRRQVTVALVEPLSRRLKDIRALEAAMNECGLNALKCMVAADACRAITRIDVDEAFVFGDPPVDLCSFWTEGDFDAAIKELTQSTKDLGASIDAFKEMHARALLNHAVDRAIGEQIHQLLTACYQHGAFAERLGAFVSRYQASADRAWAQAAFRDIQQIDRSLKLTVTGALHHAVNISPLLIGAVERLQSLLEQALNRVQSAPI